MATTEKAKARPKGTGLGHWRNGGKYSYRIDAVIERAKREGTLGKSSRHLGIPVTEQEIAARVRVDLERIKIAAHQERLAAKLKTGRLTEEERIEKRREKHRARYRDLRSRAEDHAEEERLDELAELMQAA